MNRGYESFLSGKRIPQVRVGFEPDDIADHLFDYQSAVVSWALRLGRACIFAGTGLGKTLMQVEWARQVVNRTGGRREHAENDDRVYGGRNEKFAWCGTRSEIVKLGVFWGRVR